MATITVRDREYELIENENASTNAILVFLNILDPEGSKKFAGLGATFGELQSEIARKYSELSEEGKKLTEESSTRIVLLLNLDPELFPDVISYRKKAYQYLKVLIPSIPPLDENLSGTELADFLLAVAVPESLRKNADEKLAKPANPKPRKSKNSKSVVTNAPESEEDDEAAGALIEQLTATSGVATAVVDASTTGLEVETKVVDLESIAAVAPEIVEATDNYYAELLAEQQRHTVTILNKSEVVPTDIEEELGV